MMKMSPLHSAGFQHTRVPLNLILLSSLSISSLVWPALSASPPSRDDCEPKDCGRAPSIRYPFWIGGGQPSHCGYPTFMVTCKDDAPVINIYDDDYLVRDIFYDNQSFLVSSVDLSSSSCPVPRYNLSLGATPFTVDPTNRHLSFFLNCTGVVPGYRIDCAADGSGRQYFVDGPGQVKPTESCGSFVIWPFIGDGIAEGDQNYAVPLKNGFLLKWDADFRCSVCRESGGRCRYDPAQSRFSCACSDRSHAVRCYGTEGIKGGIKRKMILGIVAGTSGILLSCVTLCCCYYKKSSRLSLNCARKSENSENVETFLEQYGTSVPKRYRYVEVKRMTKSFTEKLGQGGYGTVFKGKLPDGQLTAVKVLKSEESAEEFINEVASIGRTHHVNVVGLLGFCCEGSKRALLYEYMPNGSLEKFIFLRKSPDHGSHLGWEKLLEIAVGIARGLEYLHRGCKTRIVHFDIKPHNILLDEDFCPKISDFGLAQSCRPKQSILSTTGMRGTIGYIAPEVFSRNFGAVSSKSDVYSYGMMVLEMVGGRRNAEARTDSASDVYFPHWIYDHFDDDAILRLDDVTNETEEVARKMILVGLWCIQTSPSNRPSMSEVLDMLEGKFEDLQMPPKPYLSTP